jgi:hypothetical protein
VFENDATFSGVCQRHAETVPVERVAKGGGGPGSGSAFEGAEKKLT